MDEKKRPASLDPRTLAKITGLHLRARHIVEGFVSGLHRSPYHGFSIEFAEHREYVPGDDLRYVDWKVFGRTDKFYLKQFEDETNLLCYLVLDVSESMRYRGPHSHLSKFEYAQSLAAALAWLVLQQQDAVGVVTFDSEIRSFLRPSNNPAHLQQVMQALEQVNLKHKTSAGRIFHELAERMTKRGVVIVFSDLFDDVDSISAGLKHFRYRQHDVIVFQILDSAEEALPFDRPTRFQGLEGFPDVVTDPRTLRKAYQTEMSRFLNRLRGECRRLELDHRLIRTDRPLDEALSSYLSTRMERVK